MTIAMGSAEPPPETPRRVDARQLWSGGAATAVVAALVALVGVLVCRWLFKIPILAPAIWSALAIGFAESISDFGVAATLRYNSNFSLATYQLFAAIGNFPPDFPLASAMGMLLVAAIAIPLALQARALRGRSYQILSGRTRQVIRRQLSPRQQVERLQTIPFLTIDDDVGCP